MNGPAYLLVGALLSGVDVPSQRTNIEAHLSHEAPGKRIDDITDRKKTCLSCLEVPSK